MSNPCLDAVSRELDAAGVPFKVSPNSKHVHIHYGDALQHLHIVAATPSDWRAPHNERAQIRRELRAFGYIGAEQASAPGDFVPVQLVDGQPTCTSQDIAQTFGKEHKNVLRDIDRFRAECGAEFDRLNFEPIDYLDAKGRSYRAFRMSRDGFALVVMGFTGAQATAWKVKYIEAFNRLAAEVSRLAAPSTDLSWVRNELDAIVSLIGDMEASPAHALAAPVTPRPTIRDRRRARRKWRLAA